MFFRRKPYDTQANSRVLGKTCATLLVAQLQLFEVKMLILHRKEIIQKDKFDHQSDRVSPQKEVSYLGLDFVGLL